MHREQYYASPSVTALVLATAPFDLPLKQINRRTIKPKEAWRNRHHIHSHTQPRQFKKRLHEVKEKFKRKWSEVLDYLHPSEVEMQIRKCTRELARLPTWQLHLHRAVLYIVQQQYDKALEDLRDCFELSGDRPSFQAFKARGILHDALGNYEDAITDFSTALNLFIEERQLRQQLRQQQQQLKIDEIRLAEASSVEVTGSDLPLGELSIPLETEYRLILSDHDVSRQEQGTATVVSNSSVNITVPKQRQGIPPSTADSATNSVEQLHTNRDSVSLAAVRVRESFLTGKDGQQTANAPKIRASVSMPDLAAMMHLEMKQQNQIERLSYHKTSNEPHELPNFFDLQSHGLTSHPLGVTASGSTRRLSGERGCAQNISDLQPTIDQPKASSIDRQRADSSLRLEIEPETTGSTSDISESSEYKLFSLLADRLQEERIEAEHEAICTVEAEAAEGDALIDSTGLPHENEDDSSGIEAQHQQQRVPGFVHRIIQRVLPDRPRQSSLLIDEVDEEVHPENSQSQQQSDCITERANTGESDVVADVAPMDEILHEQIHTPPQSNTDSTPETPDICHQQQQQQSSKLALQKIKTDVHSFFSRSPSQSNSTTFQRFNLLRSSSNASVGNRNTIESNGNDSNKSDEAPAARTLRELLLAYRNKLFPTTSSAPSSKWSIASWFKRGSHSNEPESSNNTKLNDDSVPRSRNSSRRSSAAGNTNRRYHTSFDPDDYGIDSDDSDPPTPTGICFPLFSSLTSGHSNNTTIDNYDEEHGDASANPIIQQIQKYKMRREASKKTKRAMIALDDILYLRGLSYYHNKQYYDAISDWTDCISIMDRLVEVTSSNNNSNNISRSASSSSINNSSALVSAASNINYSTLPALLKEKYGLYFFYRACAYFYTYETDHSLADLNRALETGNQETAEIYLMRAACYLTKGLFQQANADQRHAMSLNPRVNVNSVYGRLLTEDTLLHIVTFLSARDLVNFALCCRHFHAIAYTPELWTTISLPKDTTLLYYYVTDSNQMSNVTPASIPSTTGDDNTITSLLPASGTGNEGNIKTGAASNMYNYYYNLLASSAEEERNVLNARAVRLIFPSSIVSPSLTHPPTESVPIILTDDTAISATKQPMSGSDSSINYYFNNSSAVNTSATDRLSTQRFSQLKSLTLTWQLDLDSFSYIFNLHGVTLTSLTLIEVNPKKEYMQVIADCCPHLERFAWRCVGLYDESLASTIGRKCSRIRSLDLQFCNFGSFGLAMIEEFGNLEELDISHSRPYYNYEDDLKRILSACVKLRILRLANMQSFLTETLLKHITPLLKNLLELDLRNNFVLPASLLEHWQEHLPQLTVHAAIKDNTVVFT